MKHSTNLLPEMESEQNKLLSLSVSEAVTEHRVAQACNPHPRKPKHSVLPTAVKTILESREPVFVVNNEYDQEIIERHGYRVIAITTDPQVNQLISLARKGKIKAPLLLMMRNNHFGSCASHKISQQMTKLNQSLLLCSGDAIEAGLIVDPAWASSAVEVQRCLSDNAFTALVTEDCGRYLANNYADDMEGYRSCCMFRPGFPSLEKILPYFAGGITILTGAPGSGKTSFAVSLARNMAKEGIPVLFFELEQTKAELITKMIACEAYCANENTTITSATIRGNEEVIHTPEFIAASNSVVTLCNKAIYIYDSIYEPEQIIQAIDIFRKQCGRRPFVIIDYLQKIADPLDDNGRPISDIRIANKEKVEMLRMYCHDHLIPALALSSVARGKYKDAGSIDAGKETGEIDYSAVAIMGISRVDDANSAADAEPKKILLKISKARFSPHPAETILDFHPSHDTFSDPCDAAKE